MLRIAKEKKKALKKEKVLKDKSELRKKMSVIATSTIENDEDLRMSDKLWDEVRRKGFEHVGEKSDDDEGEAESAAADSDDESDEDDSATENR